MYAPIRISSILAVPVVCSVLLGAAAARAQDLWADEVMSYYGGTDPDPAEGYTDPSTVLGPPERYTGEAGGWPGAVTPFNPPWGTDEIVSLGGGGHLTVRFDQPITDDPGHLHDADFIIFGNGCFADADWPNGVVDYLSEEGPFTVSVSADGTDFIPLDGIYGDGLFPTLGYLDLTGPYDSNPGSVPSNFLKPVDPSLTETDFVGKSFAEVVEMYDGSGGGLPFDIGPTGLSEVYYVRIDVLAGATSPEFDAFAAVPEPRSAVLLGTLLMTSALRREC